MAVQWSETPEAAAAIAATEQIKGLCRAYQYAALHALAAAFDGGQILELGCYHGRSALIMSLAAPNAHIVTLSPDREHVAMARQNLAGRNAEVLHTTSVELLRRDRRRWDMVFVDGDHKHVNYDLPWFNRLRTGGPPCTIGGGLMLFHDYTPADALQRSHVEVYEAVNRLAAHLGRELDVVLVDEYRVGMAGLFRREGETW
jgi:predicted O-methyltransferase YrrM